MKNRMIVLRIKFLSRIILYSLFLYATKLIINHNSTKTIYIIIASVALLINLYYDYLKYKTEKVMALLAEAQDPLIIKNNIDRIIKYDIAKGMVNSLIIPKILLAFDSNNPQEVLSIIEKNDKFLRSKLDYLLIRRYSCFKAYFLLGESQLANDAFYELQKLKDTNIKNKQMKLLFNWKQIDALYEMNNDNFKFSKKLYAQVDLKNFNKRERVQYYFENLILSNKMNNKHDSLKFENKIKELNPHTNLI